VISMSDLSIVRDDQELRLEIIKISDAGDPGRDKLKVL